MAPVLDEVSLSQAQGGMSTAPTQQARKKQRLSQGTAASIASERAASHADFARANALGGTIKRIELVNFMNHGNLIVDLKPGVNFVFGRNGSGKSALLSGCMVGLGCKTNAVGRGNKLDTYIKNGKQHAKIKIFLYNGGEDAYRPAEFGQEIIVERHLTKNGAGKHLALSAHGETIYTKTSQISEICEHFNIQVGNPCVVLTQEKARRFLATTDDRHRYDFFMEATGLNVTKHNIIAMQADISRMEENLDAFELELPNLKKKVEAAQRKYEDACEVNRLDREIFEGELKVHFVRAAQAEAAAAEAEAAIDNDTSAYDAAVAKVEQVKAELEAATAHHADVSNTQGDTTRLDQIKADLHRVAQAKDKEERARNQLKTKADSFESKALNTRRNAKKVREEAEEFKRTFAERQAKEEREREARRAQARAQMEAAESTVAKLRDQEATLERENMEAGPRAAEARAKEEQLSREVKQAEAQLRQMKGASGGRNQGLAAFGAQMPAVRDLLEQNAGRFKKLPVGPVGAYINIRNKEWGLAIEQAIGNGVMHSFIVDSHDDRHQFEKLMAQHRVQHVPQVLVMRHDTNPYSIAESSLPDASFTRMIDEISFSHPMAQQACVDRSKVESSILVADRKEGTEIMFSKHAPPPRNVGKAFAKDGYAYSVRDGIQMTDYPTVDASRRKLGVDVREQVAALEAQVDEKRQEFLACQSASKEIVAAANQFERRAKEIGKQMKSARQQVQTATRLLDDIAAEGGLQEQSVEDQLEEARQLDKEAEGQLQKAEQLRDEMREKERLIPDLQRQMTELKTDADALMKSQEEAANLINEAFRAKQKAGKRLELSRKAVTAIEDKRSAGVAHVEELKATAADARDAATNALPSGMEPPDVTGQKIDALQHKLERWKKKRKQTKNVAASALDEAVLKGSLDEAQAVLNDQETRRSNVIADKDALEKARKKRSKQWGKDRRSMSEEASKSFDEQMRLRNLAGQLNFDHNNEDHKSTLQIMVKTSSVDESSNETTNVQSLSGGERSFTTMAFQIALWTFMDVPFRCMDEFDVFMDDTFRRQAVNSLLQACDRTQSGQFLFLTPQDMSSMLDNDNRTRHIFKMPDPRED